MIDEQGLPAQRQTRVVDEQDSRLPRLLSSFGYRSFRRYAPAAQIAFIGSWMLSTAQSLLVLDLSDGSGALLGLTATIQFAPLLALGPVIGVLADRIGPRKILMTGEVTMASVALIQALLVTFGIIDIAMVLILAGVFGIGAALEGSMRPTVLNELVPAGALPNAVGLNTFFFQIGRLVGPSCAGLLIAAYGNGPSFYLGAVALGAFAAVLGTLPVRHTAVTNGPAGIRHAAAYVLHNRRLRCTFLVTAVAGLISPNILSLAILVIEKDFATGPAAVGFAGSALALGTITGAVITATRRTVTLRSITLCGVGVCLLTAITGLAPTNLIYNLLLVPAGLVSMILLTQGSALVQATVPPELRGRVSALFAMVMLCGIPIGSPLLGILSDVLGARMTSVVCGTIVSALVAGTVAIDLLLTRRASR